MNFKSIEKMLYILVNIAVVAVFVAFLYANIDKSVEYFCPIMQKVYTTKLVYIALMIYIAANFAGFAMCAIIKSKTDELCNAYQKRHENISIAKDSDSARIATLEAKIDTLEAALEAALRNK